jgi:hypothetical protein
MTALMDATILVHRLSAIAAFALMPVSFLLPKGTRFHKLYGRLLLGVSLLVVGFSLLTLVNPAFLPYWADDVARHHWQSFLAIFGLGRGFLIWVATYYAYFFFSALRVWPRWRAAHIAGHPGAAGLPDYALTAVALGIGGYYGAIAAVWAVSSYGYPRLVVMSVALLGFGLFDLGTYLRPIRSFRTAALTHGVRLYMAWLMLLVGVAIRYTENAAPGSHNLLELTTSALTLALLAGLLLHWRRQLPAAPSERHA